MTQGKHVLVQKKSQCCKALAFGSSLQQAIIGLSESSGNCEEGKKRRGSEEEKCAHAETFGTGEQIQRARSAGKKLLTASMSAYVVDLSWNDPASSSACLTFFRAHPPPPHCDQGNDVSHNHQGWEHISRGGCRHRAWQKSGLSRAQKTGGEGWKVRREGRRGG